ncbi:MAG: hypothetical protein EBT91_07920, partial [Rhodobacteraceae bacterium]|nr:hypothetical protein [Paracoccaceae bacterium]
EVESLLIVKIAKKLISQAHVPTIGSHANTNTGKNSSFIPLFYELRRTQPMNRIRFPMLF